MKKVFPVIVLLITLSVGGILFIQIQWIKNASLLKHDQYERNLNHAMNSIREEAFRGWQEKTDFHGINSFEVESMLNKMYTSQIFTTQEFSAIIASALLQNNIKESFEYSITDFLEVPVSASANFKSEYYKQSKDLRLTPPNSLIRETLHLYIIDSSNYIWSQMGWMIGASIFFTCIIISAFALTVRTLFKQKNLSEIKSDFINNMTHEFKTPLATISLAADALNNEKVINDREKIKYYSGIIKDENRRMNKQVETILQAARIERQDVSLNLKPIDAHEMIMRVADNFALQIDEKNGDLSLNLHADKFVIDADDVHFSNIIFNLLDNAVKYSKENPEIKIETETTGDMLSIMFIDNGIGMNKETQARVFEKFYRAHTGNIHNVKGFGLGLSYVKSMVDAQQGKIKVDSTVGKGSTFTLSFPLHND